VAYSFARLGAEDQRALTVLSLVQGVADGVVLGVLSGKARTPERFRGHGVAEWMGLLERGAALGLLSPLDGSMFRLHPALPAHLAARWRAEAPDTYAEERAAAVSALVSAYAAFGVWLADQLNGENAGAASVLAGHHLRMLGAMLGLALDAGDWEEALDLLRPLGPYWESRGLTREVRLWTDRVRLAVEAPDGTPPDPRTPAGALWMFAVGYQANQDVHAGLLDQAERAHRAIKDALEQHPDPELREFLATAQLHLGVVAQHRGRLREAEDRYREALAIYRESGDSAHIAAALHQLGVAAQLQGNLTEAEGRFREALAIHERRRELTGVARTSYQLGVIALQRGEFADAERLLGHCLGLYEYVRDLSAMADIHHELGILAEYQGRLGDAEQSHRRSLAIKEHLDNRPGMAQSYHQLGVVAQLGGRLDEASEWYHHSLALTHSLDDLPGMAVSCGQLGVLAEERRDITQALTWMVRAAALFEEFPHPATGPAPRELRRLTVHLGLAALERAWLDVTGDQLPPQIRAFVLTDPEPEGAPRT
jgi:tetratricopeptide (TPR) repeat protein